METAPRFQVVAQLGSHLLPDDPFLATEFFYLTDRLLSGIVFGIMLKMRLQRIGRKNDASFRLIVTDSRRGPKSGKHIDLLGSYNPKLNQIQFNSEKIKSWIDKGVQVSDTVHNLLISEKIIEGKKRNVLPRKAPIVSEELKDEAAETGQVADATEDETKGPTETNEAKGETEEESETTSEGKEEPKEETTENAPVVDSKEEVASEVAKEVAVEEVNEEKPLETASEETEDETGSETEKDKKET